MANNQHPPHEEEWTVDDSDVTILTDPGAGEEPVLELDPEPVFTDPGKAGLDVVFTAMSPAPQTPSLAALPHVPVHTHTPQPPTREVVERLEAILASLEQECAALGDDPRAAPLHVEMGRILEERLGRARQAAQHFQRAYQLAPRDLAVLHASIRLFTQAAHWTMVAQLLANLAAVTEEQQQRAAILSGRAQVVWDKLRDPDGAAAGFKEALASWPAEPLALRSLEQILTSRVEFQPLFDAWVAAAAVESGARRLRLLERAAALAEDRLRKDDLAIQAWRDVLALEPMHPQALAALRRHYTTQKRTKELVELLTSTAVVAHGDESARLLLEAAVALKEDGQLQKALHAVQAALHSSPDMPELWEVLQQVHEAASNFDAAAAAMHKRAQLMEDPVARAGLLTQLGQVRETRLKALPQAMDAYRAAVAAQRNHLPAVRALVRLLAKEGPPEDLAEMLRLEATLEPNRDVRLARLVQLSDVLAFTLERSDEAVETLKGVLEQQRNHQAALEMMERILRFHQRWPEMAVLLEQKILATENRDQRIMLYCRLAELHEEWLDDVQGAIDAYQRVIDLAPDHLEALRAVARLQEKRGRYAEAVKATEMEVQATADRKARVPAMLRMAWLQEHHLQDDQAAVSSLERLLTYQGGVVPALRSLQRLYERLERHGDLIFALRRELETLRSLEDGVPLLRRMARAAHPLQNDVEGAIRTWKEVLERAPRDLEALDELANLYALKQDRDAQAQTLLRAAATFPPGKERHSRLLQAASLYEGGLKRPDRAVELYEEVLRDGGYDEQALNGVQRVLGAQNRWSDLLASLKATADATRTDQQKADLLTRAAVVARDRMARPDVAQENFTAALALRMADPELLAALENLQLSQRQWERAIATGVARTKAEVDSQELAAVHLRLAAMKEEEHIQQPTIPDHVMAALACVPGHPVALRELELLYLRAGASEGLMHLYQRMATLASDPPYRAHLLYRAGDIAESVLHRDGVADAYYRMALDSDQTLLPALMARRRVATRAQDDATLLQCALMELTLCAHPPRKTQLLFEAGCLTYDHAQDPETALDYWRQVLDREPIHPGAFDRLVRHHTQVGGWKPLAELLSRRAEVVPTPEEQAALLLDAARIAQTQLRDPQRAMTLYRGVLQRLPHHQGALTSLGPLLFGHALWEEAQDVFLRLVSVTKDPATLNNAWRSLGIIFEEHAPDLDRAVNAFDRALEADASDSESLSRLASIHTQAERWNLAVDALQRLAAVQQDPNARVLTQRMLARIQDERLKRPDDAQATLEEALRALPSHVPAMVALDALLSRLGRFAALADALVAFVTAVEAADHSAAITWQLRLAAVQEYHLKNDPAAVDEFMHVLDVEPNNVEALTGLARIHGRTPGSLDTAVEMHRRLLELDPFRVDSHHELHRLWRGVGDVDRAYVMAEVLVFLKAASPDEDAFYNTHKGSIPPRASAVLTPTEYERLVVHPLESGMARVLITTVATSLFDVFEGDLKKHGLERRDRHTQKSDHPLRQLADSLATVLFAPEYDLWVSQKFESLITVENRDPPALIVGEGVMRRVQDKELRFLLARELERIKGLHHTLMSMTPREVEHLLAALARVANPSWDIPQDALEVERLSKRILKALPRAVRKQLETQEERVAHVRKFDGAQQVQGAMHTGNRAGLLVTHDLDTAVRAILRDDPDTRPVFADAGGARSVLGGHPEIRELLLYVVSEQYFLVRRKMGFALQSGRPS